MWLAADIRTTLIALSNLGLLGIAHGGVAGLKLKDALAECQPRLGFSRAPGLLRFRHGFPLKGQAEHGASSSATYSSG